MPENRDLLLQQRLRLYHVMAAEPYAESVRKSSAARVWQDPCQLLLLWRHAAEGQPAAPGCFCEHCYFLYEQEQELREKLVANPSETCKRADLQQVRKSLVHELAYSPLLAISFRTQGSPVQNLSVFQGRSGNDRNNDVDAHAAPQTDLASGIDDTMPANISRTNSSASDPGMEQDEGHEEPPAALDPNWAMHLMELQQVWEIATTPVPLHEAFAASVPAQTNPERAGDEDSPDNVHEDHSAQ